MGETLFKMAPFRNYPTSSNIPDVEGGAVIGAVACALTRACPRSTAFRPASTRGIYKVCRISDSKMVKHGVARTWLEWRCWFFMVAIPVSSFVRTGVLNREFAGRCLKGVRQRFLTGRAGERLRAGSGDVWQGGGVAG